MEFYLKKEKPKLLLHICCAGCGASVARELEEEYSVTLFFYNPNIFPKSEYEKRLRETKKIASYLKMPLIVSDYDHNGWLINVEGLAREPEKGKRCIICYRQRLKSTREEARRKGFNYFSTTLTVSPHKDARKIIEIGNSLAIKPELLFLARDFKKKDGFKKASCLSQELGLYRQDYCGCEFSIKR